LEDAQTQVLHGDLKFNCDDLAIVQSSYLTQA